MGERVEGADIVATIRELVIAAAVEAARVNRELSPEEALQRGVEWVAWRITTDRPELGRKMKAYLAAQERGAH